MGRFHLARYFGVFSSHSKFRPEVLSRHRILLLSSRLRLPATSLSSPRAATSLLAKLGLAPQHRSLSLGDVVSWVQSAAGYLDCSCFCSSGVAAGVYRAGW